jgi:putative peptidoglycan lipid II flippase
MLRHIATVSTGTALSRLTGFARDVLTAALLGTTPVADAFLAAFQLVNVARRLLTEGALNAALVPAWLELRTRDGEAAATAFAGRVLGTIGLLTVAAAVLLGLAMPAVIALIAPGFASERLGLAVDAARLMLPYLAFVGPVAVLMGLLNARRAFLLAAFAPLLFNLALIAVLIALLWRRPAAGTSALVLAATVGAAGFLQLVVLGPRGRRHATPLKATFDVEMRRFLARAVPGAVASAMPQLVMLAGIVAASGAPAAVAWLYFANRLVELPLGLVGVAIGTVLVSELAHARHDPAAFARAQRQGLVLAFGLSLPAAAGLVVLAEPIVRVLFHHGAFGAGDVGATAGALALLALGLPAQVAVKMLAAAFFARGDTGTPLIATLGAVLVALIGALVLGRWLGVAGIALALAASAWLAAAWLGGRAMRVAHLALDAAAAGVLMRIALAAVAMGAALAAARALWPMPAPAGVAALQVALFIAGGFALYGLLLAALGVVDRTALAALRAAIARGKDDASNDPSRTLRHGGEA